MAVWVILGVGDLGLGVGNLQLRTMIDRYIDR